FEASAVTRITNQVDQSKHKIAASSTFAEAEGYGTDLFARKVKITVGSEGSGSGGSGDGDKDKDKDKDQDKDKDKDKGAFTGGVDGKGNGEDGTPLSKGANSLAMDAYLTGYDQEADPAGSDYFTLAAKLKKAKKNSIQIGWNSAPGAMEYRVYATKCGKGNKFAKVASVNSTSYLYTDYNGKKLKKGNYYRFIIVAVDEKGDVVSTSKTVHAATLGGKVGNCKKIKTKAKKNKAKVKVNKTFKLKTKQVAEKKKAKIKKHRALQYESTNPAVATVNKKGTIKGVSKGSCEVYVYAQDGVCAKIKVTVK
ncbi:MAG: Ig-like domain-containing protein, partial [Lachnospiraceae bacterium]|nr:Ig-like domain-containing protein [Lachnospiraceae bacterium]